jgi:hypothetical protein
MPAASQRKGSERIKRRFARIRAFVVMLVFACVLIALCATSLNSSQLENINTSTWKCDRGLKCTTPSGQSSSRGYHQKAALRRGRVAVYITGQARSLDRTICSLRRNVFAPLVQQGYDLTIFVVGENDADDAYKYASYLGPDALPKGLTLGSIVTKSRPVAPRSCVEAVLNANFRWYDSGGSGASSKNGVYTEEVLSQLRYRQDVDVARREYETRHRVTFEWIINPRPDNVFVNPIPILSGLNSAKLYVPSWGHGYDPRSLSEDKRRVGINDRFSFGGREVMGKYHDLYRVLCGGSEAGGKKLSFRAREDLDAVITRMPARMNFEQLVHWYLRTVVRIQTEHIPGEFWFFRLRKGPAPRTLPLEHPGHRPALVSSLLVKSRGETGAKRWDVWREACMLVWECDGSEAVRRGRDAIARAQRTRRHFTMIAMRRMFPDWSFARNVGLPGGSWDGFRDLA